MSALGFTALLVHINHELMGFMREVLEAKGLEVLESQNPAEALRLVEEQHPDLVIHNYQMPFMDGVTFDRKIRLQCGPRQPAIVWISLTPLKPKHVTTYGIRAWIKPFFEPDEFSYFMDEVLTGLKGGQGTGTEG